MYFKILIFLLCIFNSYSNLIITLKKDNFLAIDDKINDNNVNLWIRNISSIMNDPIYIYIDSPGGNVDSGLRLINTIKYYQNLNKTFDCIAQNAYSMAFYIFQNCNNRFITPSAILMQHQMSLGSLKGSLKNLNSYISFINDMSYNLDEFTYKKLNISREEYDNKITTDWWIYGESILKYNAADDIVLIGCDDELYNLKIEYEDDVIGISELGVIEINTVKKYKDLCPL